MVLTEAGTVEQELLLPACGNHVTSQGIQQRSAHQASTNGAIQFSYQEKWCHTVFLDLCSVHFRIKQLLFGITLNLVAHSLIMSWSANSDLVPQFSSAPVPLELVTGACIFH